MSVMLERIQTLNLKLCLELINVNRNFDVKKRSFVCERGLMQCGRIADIARVWAAGYAGPITGRDAPLSLQRLHNARCGQSCRGRDRGGGPGRL